MTPGRAQVVETMTNARATTVDAPIPAESIRPTQSKPKRKRREMANILHRISIDAPTESVHGLIATKDGIEQWWTGHPVRGDDALGGQLSVYFSDAGEAAAVFEVVEQTPQEIAWRCVDGPDDWRDTRISFAFKRSPDGGTTLLFSHEDWKSENEFMHGCSTNWGAYLTSLKYGAEGRGFQPYPAGEVSRWG